MVLLRLIPLKRAWLILCSFFTLVGVYGQADSLIAVTQAKKDTGAVKAYIQLFWYYFNEDIEKAKLQLDKASDLESLAGYPVGQANVARSYGVYYGVKGEYEKANQLFKQALVQHHKLGNLNGEAACWNELGIIASERGDFETATRYYQKVKKIYQQLGNKKGIAMMSTNLGQLYYLRKKPDKAIAQIKAALKLMEGTENQRGMMAAYNTMSSVYSLQGEFKKAIAVVKMQQAIAKSLNDQQQLAGIQHNLGTIYDRAGITDSAMIYWNRALGKYNELGLIPLKSMVLLNISGLELKSKQFDQALAHANEGISLAKEMGAMKTVTEGYDLLMKIYRDKGDFENAFIYSQRTNALNDSLIGAETRNKMNEMNIKYEAEEKEHENNLLLEQQKVNELQIARQNYLIIALVIFLLLTSGITVFYIRNKRSKQAVKQAELEQKALRAQMNPHFIFNSLNSIQRMYMQGDHATANDFMGEFGDLLRTILENSGKSSISLKKELDTLRLYMDLEKLRTEGLVDYELNVDKSIDQLNSNVPPLIIQPFVENAIWHGILPTGRNGRVTINIQKENKDALCCSITDDGVGINNSKRKKANQKHEARGMQITADRLKIPNAVKAEELPSGGTKITLHIPVS